jgi:hypothetical protein
MGNLQVRFLEGWASAMAPGYSTKWIMASPFIGSGASLTNLYSHELLPEERVSPGYLLNFTREGGMIYHRN